MNALAWLIPLALTLGLFGLVAFLWALRSGQFDDLEGAAYRILEDDDEVTGSPSKNGAEMDNGQAKSEETAEVKKS
jgi:cbb3-type cytochrome oxidase maturation protein